MLTLEGVDFPPPLFLAKDGCHFILFCIYLPLQAKFISMFYVSGMSMNVNLKTPSRISLLVVLLTVCAAVYGNTFLNGWTYDDIPVVVRNSDAHSLKGFLENSRPGRPMRELSYIPEYLLFGENPAGYHVQQLFWHGANGCLLLILFIALGVEPLYAMLGVVFFLVHPLQSESVANISHRKELLPLFFSLLALIAYIKAVAAQGLRRYFLLLLVAAGYVCALLSNETAVTFPLLLALYEYLYLSQGERFFLKRPILLLLCMTSAAVLFFYRYQGLFSSDQLLTVYSKYSFEASRSFIPLWMADLKAFGFYFYKIVLPVNLAPEYHVTFSEQIFQPLALVSAALLAGIAYLFFVLRRSLPSVAFGIGWFLIFYLPISNVLPVSYLLADRYMYLCLPGVGLLLAGLLQKIHNNRFTIVTCLFLVILAVLTVIQNNYWKDENTLWRHAVTVNPNSTWVQETVALSYLLSNQFEKARYHSRLAISLNRYNTRAYLTLAKSEDRLGNLDVALKNYESFCSFGVFEYPEEVATIKKYLPFLRARAHLLYSPG